MKVALFSNYLNHHQLPFCLAMDRLTEGNFTFVATSPIPKFRLELGYENMNKKYPFVLRTYASAENRQKAKELAASCDVVITGSAPEGYTKLRMQLGLLTFRYSERIYKKGILRAFSPKNISSNLKNHTQYWNKPLYMLCASAYTARDYALSGAYLGKTYKWGYYPAVQVMDTEQLFAQKEQNEKPVILWVARLIELKHPEMVVELAGRLKAEGYDFELRMVGNGELEEQIARKICEAGLEDRVFLLGAMSPEAVREQMNCANVFLFTSDRNEGWGAVLNESMNSGCAVVASHIIGSVPFLMKDGENGLIYRDRDGKMLYEKVKYLLDHPQEQRRLGEAAYRTMTELWNGDVAAERILQLSEDLRSSGSSNRYADGPCSPAKRLADGWYSRKKTI